MEEEGALVKNNCRSTVTGSYTACRVQRYIDMSYVNLSFLLKGANQARSFDIRESHSGTSDRPPVSKSFSFGGYPAPQVRESNQVLMAIGVLIFSKTFQPLEPRRAQGGAGPSYRSSPHPPALPRGQVLPENSPLPPLIAHSFP